MEFFAFFAETAFLWVMGLLLVAAKLEEKKEAYSFGNRVSVLEIAFLVFLICCVLSFVALLIL